MHNLRAAIKCLLISKAPGTRAQYLATAFLELGGGAVSRGKTDTQTQAHFVKLIQYLLNCELLQTWLKSETHSSGSLSWFPLEKEAWSRITPKLRGETGRHGGVEGDGER